MIMFRNKFTKKMQNKVNTDKYNFINLETKENIEKNIKKTKEFINKYLVNLTYISKHRIQF